MKKLIRKPAALLSSLLLTLMLSMALTSCSTDSLDDYYYSPLLGGWQLDAVNGVPVTEPEVAIFYFSGNGTGTYGQYSPSMVWNEYSITWECDFPNDVDNYLYVYTWNGQTWMYRFRVSSGYLTLVDLSNGNNLSFIAI